MATGGDICVELVKSHIILQTTADLQGGAIV